MTSWKTWLGFSFLFAIAVLCYPHLPRSTTPSGKTAKTTIVYWGPLQMTEAIRTAVEEFERINPQYHVEIGTATHRDTIGDDTRFLLGVAGGQPPDCMGINRLVAVELGARGAFADLYPFIEADRARLAELESKNTSADAKRSQEVKNLRDGVRQKDYFPPLWDESCYQGHQFAISNQANVRTLYLNDDYLIRAGFTDDQKTPRPPKSWEDICRKLFHGAGSVTSAGLVRLSPSSTPPTRPVQPGDVVTIGVGTSLFRARIKSVNPDATFNIDFTRELAPDITSVPSTYTSAAAPEIKIFDANSYAVALTRFDERGNIAVLGFTPLGGNSWLLNFAWQAGAELVSSDGTKAQFDDPRVKNALQFMVDCCDSMGGYKITAAFEKAQEKTDEQAPFIVGKIAMVVNGSWFLNYIAVFRNDFRFTSVAPPLPEARLKEGVKPFTWIGGASYVIPASARNPRGGWELLRFLCSEKGRKIQYEVDFERRRGAGQLFVPDFPCRIDMVPWVRQTYLAKNPMISPSVLNGFDVAATLLPHAMFRAPTPFSNKLFEAQENAGESAMGHRATVENALSDKNAEVQEAIDRQLHPPTGPRVHWPWLVAAYVLLLAIGAAFLVRSEVRRRKAGFGQRDWKAGFTCVSPWLVGFIIFGGGPFLFSLIISFCRYDILHPAQFVGFDNYIQLLGFHTDALGRSVPNDPKIWRSLINTAFMLIGLPLSIGLGLLLALFLNNQFRGIAIFRTLFYLPHVIPAVASFLLWIWVFDPNRGLLNSSLLQMGVNHPPLWLSDAAWSKPAIILMGLWGIGGGMLIWLAGLKAIPVQLYEAAEIDGAGTFRQFFNVTLPMLSPYIFFNTVMGIIGTLQVFEAAFIMTNGGPNDSTLFYAYYLFNQAFRYLDMGAASAMAWILFVIVLSLTLLQLKLSKRWVHYD